MRPWFRGFTGTIEPKDDTMTSYTVKGRFEVRGDQLLITELPILTWTRNYKNHLEELAQKDVVSDIREFHKDNSIKFEVVVPNLKTMSHQDIEKEFKLTSSLSCNNFVLFDRDYHIRRYENECQILQEFFDYRFEMYVKRREDMLKRCRQAHDKSFNKHRFVTDIIHRKLEIFGKKREQIVQMLKDQGFKTYEQIYPINKREEVLETSLVEEEDVVAAPQQRKKVGKFDIADFEQKKGGGFSKLANRNNNYGYLMKQKILSFT